MSRRKINPFEVLGIHPQGLVKLNHAQVRDVVTTMYRSLSRHFHPDNAEKGDVARFKAVNEAYNTLTDDPEALKFWLTSLRSGGKKQRDMLQEELERLTYLRETLEQRLLDFWMSREHIKISGIFHQGKLNDAFDLENLNNDTPFYLCPTENGHKHYGLDKVFLESEESPPEDAIWPQLKIRKPYYWRKKKKTKNSLGNFTSNRIIGGISEDGVQEILGSEPKMCDAELIEGSSFNSKYAPGVPIASFLRFIHLVKPEIKQSDEVVTITSCERIRFYGKLTRYWSST